MPRFARRWYDVNRLQGEKSPYLLQHAANPVQWYPWGDEAFDTARREDKPIFLSIGYSTCHWCHVMERESFEDPQVAELLNRVFVSIKVDREERPDLDEHYMAASQMLTGAGGWPLTIMMTPDLQPFYAATYIPKENAHGRMGMMELVPRIADLWTSRRADVLASARTITEELEKATRGPPGGFSLDEKAAPRAARALSQMFDSRYGGFGSAPKFPMPTLFPLLLRAWRRDGDPETLGMVERTLSAMRAGGIFDQVGFGFHRYSTDPEWRVPHFEKMLYDQALLALAYTEAWQATGKDLYRRTALEVFTYVLRDLALSEGGFATAEDADSEGVEGRFYVWSAEEMRAVLGEAAYGAARRRYGVREDGENILHMDGTADGAPGPIEEALYAARGARARPLRDDKVLADWNGLMIAALARAGSAFDDHSLLHAAEAAGHFVLGRMRTPDGRLLHRHREGEAAIPAFADDHAFLAWGMLELYEATFSTPCLEQAIELVNEMLAHFWDPESGGFFQTADDAPGISVRRKSLSDGVIPSANAVGLMLLSKLHRITGNPDYEKRARAVLLLYPPDAPAEAISCSAFLSAADFAAGPTAEVVIAGEADAADTRAMLSALQRRFLPDAVILLRPGGAVGEAIARLAPYTAAQQPLRGRATAYVCRDFSCRLPTNEIDVMLEQLDAIRSPL